LVATFLLETLRRMEAGEDVSVLARELGVSRKSIYKWRDRYRLAGGNTLRGRGRMTKAERFDAASGSSTRSGDPLVECLVVLKQSPIPFSPTSRMKASACDAISSASAFDQNPPARKLDGARNTLESVSMRSSAALSLSPRARSGE
jgi:transposase-like protein